MVLHFTLAGCEKSQTASGWGFKCVYYVYCSIVETSRVPRVLVDPLTCQGAKQFPRPGGTGPQTADFGSLKVPRYRSQPIPHIVDH